MSKLFFVLGVLFGLPGMALGVAVIWALVDTGKFYSTGGALAFQFFGMGCVFLWAAWMYRKD